MTTTTTAHRPPSTDDSMENILDELGSLAVGLGIMAFALFPLSVPVILLTLVLVVPLVPVAVAAGLIVAPIALVRRVRSRRP